MGVPPLEGHLVFVIWMETGFRASVQVCRSVWWERGLEKAGGPGWLFWSVWEKLSGFLAWWTDPRPTLVCGPGSCREVKPTASAAYLAGSEMCKYIIHKAAKERLGRICGSVGRTKKNVF